MDKIVVDDYHLTISEFLSDVNDWLENRIPRDSTDVDEIFDTKKMWNNTVYKNPKKYVQYDNLYNNVCGHTNGFIIKQGIGKCDKSMLFAVMSVLSAMDNFYQIGGMYQKSVLLQAIKKYKLVRAKNVFERAVVLMKKPERFLAMKQR